jgi:hypothetical protein
MPPWGQFGKAGRGDSGVRRPHDREGVLYDDYRPASCSDAARLRRQSAPSAVCGVSVGSLRAADRVVRMCVHDRIEATPRSAGEILPRFDEAIASLATG